MKKLSLTLAALAAAVIFSSCSFSEIEPATPVLTLSGIECSVSCGGRQCKLTVTNAPQGLTTVRFREPKSMEGFVYSFSPDGFSVGFGQLSFNSDGSWLSPSAVPQLIYSILNDAAGDGELTLSSITETDGETVAAFTGDINGCSYTICTDRDTGILKSISSKALGISVKF